MQRAHDGRMSQPPPEEIVAKIKKKARNLGFDDCRICNVDAPVHEVQAGFDTWLAQGMNGTMGWFDRSAKARKDLRTRYDWARSMIVLRIDYPADLPEASEQSIARRIARYAQTKDYHDLHADLLERMAKFVARFDDGIDDYGSAKAPMRPGGCQAIPYQDTGPILEHVYAERAGIGWTGKHTLTLNAKSGSYFFLAEIVTSLELPVDEAATSHCGTCNACIDACPTSAIIEPYKLDARACISYLTIEHKEDSKGIEKQWRDQLAGWFYGCDICQQVCPYNAKRAERDGPRPPAYLQHEPLLRLTLLDVLILRDAQLEAELEGTPLVRTGAGRLKRNAALLIGSEQIEDSMKGLNHCLTHPEDFVRIACAWALGCFTSDKAKAQARAWLSTHQKRESEETVRDEVIASLERLTA